MDLNPFHIGPIEAGVLTCVITMAVVVCWLVTNSTITQNVKEICATIRYVWNDLRDILTALVNRTRGS